MHDSILGVNLSYQVVTPAKATRRSTPNQLYDFEDAYGYRPNRPLDVYYLNPWEFHMLWEVCELPQPRAAQGHSLTQSLSVWTTAGKNADGDTELTPGIHYECNPRCTLEGVLFYPDLFVLRNFRHRWYLQRRRKPMIPCPTNMPMPDRAGSREAASKLFNVYMRPWVLYQEGATTAVPHIRDLDRRFATVAAVQPPRKRLRGKQLNPDDDERSHACAWSQYVRGHIVSRHAHRLIVQFMAACCKATRGREDIINDPEKEQKRREAPAAAKLPLVRLHAI